MLIDFLQFWKHEEVKYILPWVLLMYILFFVVPGSIIVIYNVVAADPINYSKITLDRISENVDSAHRVEFVSESLLSTGQTIEIDYPSSSFSFGIDYDYTDMELLIGDTNDCSTSTFTSQTLAASTGSGVWQATYTNSGNPQISFTSTTETIQANRCVKIILNTNGGTHNISNPSVATNSTYIIDLAAGSDTASLVTVILNDTTTPDPDQIGVAAELNSSVSLDLDVSPANCANSTETGAAANIVDFGTVSIGNLSTSDSTNNFICIDLGTNSANGLSVYVQSSYTGTDGALVHTNLTNTIDSVTADLTIPSNSGYGIRISSLGSTDFGSLNAQSPYDSGTSGNIGLLPGTSSGANLLINSGTTVKTSDSDRVAIEVAVKPPTGSIPGDYSDTIDITVIENP